MAYDLLGNKLAESTTYPKTGGGSFTKTHSYSFNPNSTKASFTYPDASNATASSYTANYTYDAANRLAAITLPNAGVISYGGYVMDRPQTVSLPGGTLMLRPHDQLLRPTAINANRSSGTILSFNYNYDAAHNITAWNQSGSYQGAFGNRTYSYDNIDQITSASSVGSVAEEQYLYDNVGNRLAGPNIFGSTAHNARNQLLADGLRNYAYDANGSLTSIASASSNSTLAYNPEGRLSAFQTSNSQSAILVSSAYEYDPFNRRLKKSVTQNGTTATTYFHYADEGIVAEYDGSGQMLREYGWKPSSLWGTDPAFFSTRNQELETRILYYYLTDHLGTPHALIDSVGATVWAASYDTFGQATVQIGSVMANGVRQSRDGSDIENNLRFPGQYFDSESGLHYNFHRYYSPTTGRYNSIDLYFDGVNWYIYVNNNTLTLYDNIGLLASGNAPTSGMQTDSYIDPKIRNPGIKGRVDPACYIACFLPCFVTSEPFGFGVTILGADAAASWGKAAARRAAKKALKHMAKKLSVRVAAGFLPGIGWGFLFYNTIDCGGKCAQECMCYEYAK